jgi:hypothetical protein
VVARRSGVLVGSPTVGQRRAQRDAQAGMEKQYPARLAQVEGDGPDAARRRSVLRR